MKRPKTRVYIAATVDGFIARLDDRIDWLAHETHGDDYGWVPFRESIDTLIIGRRTYEQVLSFGMEWPYKGLTTVVWSRSLSNDDVPKALRAEKVEISALAPEALLNDLGERGLKHAWVDGGRTLQTFLAEGLVDVITVTRIPILIGEGIPLFGALPADLHLEHLSTDTFASSVVQSTYAVHTEPTAAEMSIPTEAEAPPNEAEAT
jgi:dihydrofolate reductase